MEMKHSPLPIKAGVTALDLAKLIRRMSHIFEINELGNYDTSDALMQLAEYLQTLGAVNVEDLPYSPRPARHKEVLPETNYGSMSLENIMALLDTGSLSKAKLVDLARSRFGMPGSRLKRLTAGEVHETVKAAAAHEESLNIIERNAAASGQARQS